VERSDAAAHDSMVKREGDTSTRGNR
jgi:hypothetical protein